MTNGFEPPHTNGAAHTNGDSEPAKRAHAPWEFLVLFLFVLLIGSGIIVGWVLFGSKSPERLSTANAASIATACTNAQNALKALPNSYPIQGADRVARLRSENAILRTMVGQIEAVPVAGTTQAAAVKGWSTDWSHVIDSRDRYAANLDAAKGTEEKIKFVLPSSTTLKPVTRNMDDYVRENHPHLDPCFTEGLQLEIVEGQRTYKQVTK